MYGGHPHRVKALFQRMEVLVLKRSIACHFWLMGRQHPAGQAFLNHRNQAAQEIRGKGAFTEAHVFSSARLLVQRRRFPRPFCLVSRCMFTYIFARTSSGLYVYVDKLSICLYLQP